MSKLWLVACAIASMSFSNADGSVDFSRRSVGRTAIDSHAEWSRHHVRSLVDSAKPTKTTKKESFLLRPEATESKQTTESTTLVSNWFIVGISVSGVSTVAIGLWLMMRLKRKRDPFNDALSNTTRSPSVLSRIEEIDEDSSPDFVTYPNKSGNLESNDKNQPTVAGAEQPGSPFNQSKDDPISKAMVCVGEVDPGHCAFLDNKQPPEGLSVNPRGPVRAKTHCFPSRKSEDVVSTRKVEVTSTRWSMSGAPTNCGRSSDLNWPRSSSLADEVKISMHTLDVIVENGVRLNVQTCRC